MPFMVISTKSFAFPTCEGATMRLVRPLMSAAAAAAVLNVFTPAAHAQVGYLTGGPGKIAFKTQQANQTRAQAATNAMQGLCMTMQNDASATAFAAGGGQPGFGMGFVASNASTNFANPYANAMQNPYYQQQMMMLQQM